MEHNTNRNFTDYLSIAVTTFGVGYLPLMPGTFGSAVAIGIYLLIRQLEISAGAWLVGVGWRATSADAWLAFASLLAFLLFILLGIWASLRATKIFSDKDPQKVVVDEVMGQLLVFFFVPLGISWWLVLAGFGLFRLFDIWKPYPIDSLQDLPGGIGVCADDLLAGFYGGICLNLLYAISLSFS